MKTTSKLIVFIFTFLALAASAYGESPRDPPPQVLPELVISWPANPDDTVLRQQVIKLSRASHPALSIPDAARETLARGDLLTKNAKGKPDHERAIAMYAQALNHAPWWGLAYQGLALAQERAGQYESVIRTLRFYLQIVPVDSDDARMAHMQILSNEAKIAYERHRRQEAEKLCAGKKPRAVTADGGTIVCGSVNRMP